MKLTRLLSLCFALAIPALAIADSATTCCTPGATCCRDGACPSCKHVQ